MTLKKLLTYFLIASIFLSNSVGVIIVYNQIKIFHKRAIKSSIKENTFNQIVEVLAFPKSALNSSCYDIKFIDNHEFRFNGKMYDVIESWETEDTIFYKCINDSKEEQLEKSFVQYVVNNHHRQDLPLPIKQIINSINIDLFCSNSEIETASSQIIWLLLQRDFDLVEQTPEIPEPPPRFI